MFLLLRSVYGIMLVDANIFSYLVISFVIAIQASYIGAVHMCTCVILAKACLHYGNTNKRAI